MAAATETGLPVWLGISPFRLEDGTLVGLPDLGDGESLEVLKDLADGLAGRGQPA